LQTYFKVKNPLTDPNKVPNVEGHYTLPEPVNQPNSDLHFVILPDPTSPHLIAAASATKLSERDN
jgi:hypothetical protein